jgi:hypothetical protein
MVGESIPVQKIKHDCRVQRSAFVCVDERVISDQKPQEMKRLLVNRLWFRPKATVFDVVQCELYITTVPHASVRIRVFRDNIIVDRNDVCN